MDQKVYLLRYFVDIVGMYIFVLSRWYKNVDSLLHLAKILWMNLPHNGYLPFPTAAVYCGDHLIHPHSLAASPHNHHHQVISSPQTHHHQVISLAPSAHTTQYHHQLTPQQDNSSISRLASVPRYKPQELTGTVLFFLLILLLFFPHNQYVPCSLPPPLVYTFLLPTVDPFCSPLHSTLHRIFRWGMS